jgi:group I intron endonuclease
MASIYRITNKINNKSYIGYTKRKNIYERIQEHFSPSVYENNNKPLYNAIKKYGKNNFVVDVLFEGLDEEEVLQKEIVFIEKFGDYNLHPGGNIPPNQKGKTWNLSEETKQRMRKPKSPRTEEHRKKLSEALKGKTSWNKGKIGVQESIWKGQRKSPMTSKWKITKEHSEFIIENLVLWCEENGYNTNTVKTRYYGNKLPYKDILKIEKVK